MTQLRLRDLPTRLRGPAVAPDRLRRVYASLANLRRGAPTPTLWAKAQLREVGRTAAPTATATIATGVAIMITFAPQMEGKVIVAIFAAWVSATWCSCG